MEVYHI